MRSSNFQKYILNIYLNRQGKKPRRGKALDASSKNIILFTRFLYKICTQKKKAECWIQTSESKNVKKCAILTRTLIISE